ncbi:MAG TPA: SDR family oxidoreductase [Steroidobacteraceae bacterium]|nr:SDR family oxidoreductase [Steroidobacteraceae bacterium]
MFTFANKNALIIGAGRNIGRAIALEFARRGARVAVADVDGSGAAETAQLICAAGGAAAGIACDATSEESLREAVHAAERFLGDIDVHMNNAGIIHSGNPEDFPAAEWERIFNVNLFGAVRANALVLPKMLARGRGYIVNTASFAGLYPYAVNRIPYAASKAALVSMSENLALYLHPRGIRVSCLCPGPTMTTATFGMKPWSANVVMRGPGSDLEVRSQEHAATVLAEGMCAGRTLILTHEAGWDTLRRRAASPDDFIQEKIDEFARGVSGLPGH